MSSTKLTDREVRALRARVYGECSDSIWEVIRWIWMRPESQAWLKKELLPDGEKESVK